MYFLVHVAGQFFGVRTQIADHARRSIDWRAHANFTSSFALRKNRSEICTSSFACRVIMLRSLGVLSFTVQCGDTLISHRFLIGTSAHRLTPPCSAQEDVELQVDASDRALVMLSKSSQALLRDAWQAGGVTSPRRNSSEV